MKNVTLKNKFRSNDLRSNEEEYADHVVPGCVSISLPGPFKNLSALFDASTRSLALAFESTIDSNNEEGIECKTHIQVLDMVCY